ncbi:MAG: KTSC domain-containing protein [Solirubrobacteraceae bacterium]|nr:KTSC domain-containing protein [Solirubrobacteraceae bacterium]
MKRIAVSSSTLARAGYDDAGRILELEFTSGALYRYFDVPREVYDALLRADSLGRYFNREIRDRYRYVRLS